MNTPPETSRIAELNDLCRKAPRIGGRWVQTEGISNLPDVDQWAVQEKIEKYQDFTPGNNRYGERDFGVFMHYGDKIFWKIDYYAPCMTKGSEDPADPKQTVRVLTIMLASEY